MTVATGTRVVTIAGDDLGTVKDVSGDCFQVNAPAAPDYWLGMDAVLESGERTVRLRVTGDRLDDLKRKGPESRRPAGDVIL